MTPKEYLAGELQAEIKHQLIDGIAYAMAGASENHNLLAGNIFSELKLKLKGTLGRTYMAVIKLRVADNFFYPDVMVVCAEDKQNQFYKTAPTSIFEVLSTHTRKFDQTFKRLQCQSIATLEEYVLVEQDKGEIQIFSRQHNWQSSFYYLGDEIHIQSLGVTLAVTDIYYQVDNEDVLAFFNKNKNSQ